MTGLVTPVILSGGAGTRLWPLSRPERPKQFLPLIHDRSMFAETLLRAADRRRFTPPIIVCGAGHVALVEEDCAALGIDDAQIIVEPAARNTAPAIALAALALEERGSDAVMLVMPSDHAMRAPHAFVQSVEAAYPAVLAGALATFGIAATRPETGYGYIEQGDGVGGHPGVHRVTRFVEKPNRDRAEAMLATGRYLWNAGIFLMRADAYLSALSTHATAIFDACTAACAAAAPEDNALLCPDQAAFAAAPAISIDCAVMEHAANIVVAPVDPGWSDVGSLAVLHDLAAQDDHGNATIGDAIALASSGSYLRTDGSVRLSGYGLSDMLVIASGGDVLITPRAMAQEVKHVAEARKDRAT